MQVKVPVALICIAYIFIVPYHVTVHDILLECITLSRGIHIIVVGNGVATPFHPLAKTLYVLCLPVQLVHVGSILLYMYMHMYMYRYMYMFRVQSTESKILYSGKVL